MSDANGSSDDGAALPKGWEWKKVGEIATVVRGVTYKKDQASSEPRAGYIPLLRSGNVQDELDLDHKLIYVPEDLARDDQRLVAGDIVVSVSNSRELVGKAAPLRTAWGGTFGAFLGVVRPSDGAVDPAYLAAFFRSPDYRQEIMSLSGATSNIANIRKGHLLDLDIALPPLEEQGRIVERIEGLVEKISEGCEILRATSEALQALRRSLLATSFAILPVDVRDADEHSAAAAYTPLAELCSAIVDCEHKTAPRDPEGRAFSIGTGNLRNGRMLLDKAKRVSDDTYVAWSRRMTLRARDIVLAREAPVGEVGMVPAGVRACLGQRTVLIRPDETRVHAEYLLFLFQGPELRAQMARLSGGSTVQHLNVGDIRRLQIPSPPSLDEQKRVVERLQTRMTEIDTGLTELEHLNGLAGRLRRSVLRSALAGGARSERDGRDQASVGKA